jgi:DNA protecting protein DprA
MKNQDIKKMKTVTACATKLPLLNASPHQIPSPKKVWIQGQEDSLALLQELPDKGLAIVGTRRPQPRSQALVKAMIRELPAKEFVIVSGFARGIDQVAHTAAIENNIPTIAILGAGFNIRYPYGSDDLRKAILQKGGLLISEYAPDTPALPHHFLQRNRLIALFSRGVVVVEAGARSGALNTAHWAREAHVDCYAVPSYPGDTAYLGNQKLLERQEAFPLWSAQSLATTWLGLNTQSNQGSFEALLASSSARQISRPEKLHAEITRSFQAQGAISVQSLYEWADHEKWSSGEFFHTLETLVQNRKVQTVCGFIEPL